MANPKVFWIPKNLIARMITPQMKNQIVARNAASRNINSHCKCLVKACNALAWEVFIIWQEWTEECGALDQRPRISGAQRDSNATTYKIV
jgi:hypothetical protein